MKHPSRLASLLCVLLALPAVALPADGLRPITHEDVFLMKRVGSPEVSPDGRWAAFTVKEPAYDKEQESTDIWLVPMDGSAAPRRITQDRAAESGLSWSPDSRLLAFTARREGDDAAQAYVLDLAGGGEARRVTDLSGGASRPVWHPDGTALLVTSMVQPGTDSDAANRAALAEAKDRKYDARVYEDFPVRHWDRWLDDREPTLYLQPIEEGAAPQDLLGATALRKSRGYGGRFDSTSGSAQLDATFSPDGRQVVFVATDTLHEAARARVPYSLWMMPAEGGEPRRLTGPEGSYSGPAFGPDGALYAKFTPFGRNTYQATRVVRLDDLAGKGPGRILTSEFDRSVEAYTLSPDGTRLYLTANDEGRGRLYQLPATGGAVEELGRLDGGQLDGISVGGTGAAIIAAGWQSAVSPREIYRVDATSGERRALSAFNAERVSAIDWLPLEEFWFRDSKGQRLHSMLALPPGFDPQKKYPLFVLIHGGPHSMMGDAFGTRWNYHLLAKPGYVVLFTNYSGSTGYGESFSQRIDGDTLRGPAREINEAADEAIRRYPFIDGSRQAAGGASYGGHLTNWLAVTTDRYKALVSHAGMFDQRSQWTTSDSVYGRELRMGGPPWEKPGIWKSDSPFTYTTRLKTPMLVTFGEKDYRVPVNNGLELWMLLKRQGVDARFIVFPGENHWILGGENSRFFYEQVHDWLGRYL
jgi:dipeptidyl aminopeptidase/acylaminoacyl peptidase